MRIDIGFQHFHFCLPVKLLHLQLFFILLPVPFLVPLQADAHLVKLLHHLPDLIFPFYRDADSELAAPHIMHAGDQEPQRLYCVAQGNDQKYSDSHHQNRPEHIKKIKQFSAVLCQDIFVDHCKNCPSFSFLSSASTVLVFSSFFRFIFLFFTF